MNVCSLQGGVSIISGSVFSPMSNSFTEILVFKVNDFKVGHCYRQIRVTQGNRISEPEQYYSTNRQGKDQ